jgi:redox-regulated HSP33 family molecular chaperone
MLTTLELRDLDEMIEEGRAEITCNYCNEVYTLTRDDLLRAREQQRPAGGATN